MKAIRIATLGVALLAGASAVAGAQNAAPPAAQQQGGPGGRGFSRTMTGIELTEAQKTKINAIMAKYQPEMQAIREAMQSGGDRAESFQKIRALREKMSPEIRGVLTPEQQAIYDKNVAEQRSRMEQRQGGGPGR